MTSRDTPQGNDYLTPDPKTPLLGSKEMTVAKLREKLKALDLPIYGCKRTLFQRLLTNSNDSASQSQFSHNTFPMFENSPGQQSYAGATPSESSIAKCSLVELRKRCKSEKLPTSGRKQELIDRLEVHYEKALLNELLEPKDLQTVENNWKSSENRFYQSRSDFASAENSILKNPYAVSTMDELSLSTKTKLQEVCKDLSLKVSGRKQEIVERIWQHISISRSSLRIPEQHAISQSKYRAREEETNSLPKKKRQKLFHSLHQIPIPSETVNDMLYNPLSLRYFMFSNDITAEYFKCSILCEDESRFAPFSVTIGRRITCTCGDCTRYRPCQHVLFVLLRVLKLSSDSPILLKTVLSEEELAVTLRGLRQSIRSVQNSKPSLKKSFFTRANATNGVEVGCVEVIRQNWVSKSCGICFEPLSSNTSMIWCRAQCGANMHMACYDKWQAQQHFEGHQCPFCEAPWDRIPKNTRFQSNLQRNRIQ